LNLRLAAETAIDAPTDSSSSSHSRRFTSIQNVNHFESLKFEGASMMSIIEVLAKSEAG
jgi:signal transduction histidine kinase